MTPTQATLSNTLKANLGAFADVQTVGTIRESFAPGRSADTIIAAARALVAAGLLVETTTTTTIKLNRAKGAYTARRASIVVAAWTLAA